MADANAVNNLGNRVESRDSTSHLHEGDLSLFNHHFYWRYDDLFIRIKDEMAAVKRCLEKTQLDKDLFDEEDLKALQERINRLKKIQVILNDRGLDDFKEIIYPVAKSVPALALIGAGGLCLVIGPVFACLFAVAFLSSNLYLKGKSSTLNIHFGIAVAIQTTAIVLAALTVTGVVMFNPALISGLVAVGGTWLFCTAVLRGGERQKEARDVKLAAIEKNMHAFYHQLRLAKKKIKTWSIIPTSQVKYCAEMDQLIYQQLLQDKPNLSRELLISRFRISDQEATEVLIDLQKLKLFHDGFSYYCDDYENLLRTVKNPFEKGKRVKDLNELLSQGRQLEADCGDFRSCIDKMQQKIEDTKDNITFVMKRDLPWFLTNIPLIILTALTVPFIGGVILGVPLLLSPQLLIAIGAIAISIGICALGFYGWEKYRQHQRAVRDAKKREENSLLSLNLGGEQAPSVSDTLKRKSRKTPMLLDEKKTKSHGIGLGKTSSSQTVNHENTDNKKKKKDQKAG